MVIITFRDWHHFRPKVSPATMKCSSVFHKVCKNDTVQLGSHTGNFALCETHAASSSSSFHPFHVSHHGEEAVELLGWSGMWKWSHVCPGEASWNHIGRCCCIFKLQSAQHSCVDTGSNLLSGRANSLHYCKKAMSGCLPNKHIPWYNVARMGNPTRLILVNQMIKKVEKKETCC